MVEQKVFQRHEAHEITTPLLMLRVSEQNNITLNAPPNASMMLDGNGVSVLLPFDLTERPTRFVARQCFSSEVLPIRPSNPEERWWWPSTRVHRVTSILFMMMEAVFLEGSEVDSIVIRALPRCLGSYGLRFNDARKTRGILDLSALPTVLVARCYDYLRTKFYSMCTLAHLSLKLRV
ncbi:hypothetical protein DD237_003534 [Peronospora effusa]|uniref:Uncharacterized protein n=1 Tax=Peronospora effusa TaxID=542832 RepID=A0A3R8CJY2_9STRA|nr:hypothetical protein DD237_003534 [Peronospora effusa]